jgi:hypothetical protein
MKDFLSSDHDDIYDPVFLAQMVLSPLNTMLTFSLICSQKQIYVQKEKTGMYVCSTCCSVMKF